MKVAMLGFLHESNTFLPVPTCYEDFTRASLTRGKEMIARWKGTHHELGGMIAGCDEADLVIAGGMATFAVPSGTITEEAYEKLADELIASLRVTLPLQGLLVALHGATVSARYPDADGEMLRRIRDVVGPKLPIVVTLDLHANISLDMVRHTTAIIAYRTNPHLDQFDRGREAALLLRRTLRGEVHPVQAIATPPQVIQISRQYTSIEPASLLYTDLKEVLTWPGILSATIAMGFYYSDVAEMGASFLAVADGDLALAHRAAEWMAARAWERRYLFIGDLPDASAAVAMAISSEKRPVVLMDTGDNVGGGSPADSTILLSEILRQGARNSLVILTDPVAVQECLRSGVRSNVELDVGAKTDGLHGQPVRIRGRVCTLSEGLFVERQVRHGGWGGGDQGITAVIETGDGHTIVLTSLRMAPLSLEQVLSLGIQPDRKDIIVVKGVVAPRAAYEPIAGDIILVGTPGVTNDDPRSFRYQHRRKPLFPLEAWGELSSVS